MPALAAAAELTLHELLVFRQRQGLDHFRRQGAVTRFAAVQPVELVGPDDPATGEIVFPRSHLGETLRLGEEPLAAAEVPSSLFDQTLELFTGSRHLFVAALDLVQHFVERLDQDAELAGSGPARAHAVVLLRRDHTSGLGEPEDGLEDRPHETGREDERHAERDEGAQEDDRARAQKTLPYFAEVRLDDEVPGATLAEWNPACDDDVGRPEFMPGPHERGRRRYGTVRQQIAPVGGEELPVGAIDSGPEHVRLGPENGESPRGGIAIRRQQGLLGAEADDLRGRREAAHERRPDGDDVEDDEETARRDERDACHEDGNAQELASNRALRGWTHANGPGARIRPRRLTFGRSPEFPMLTTSPDLFCNSYHAIVGRKTCSSEESSRCGRRPRGPCI